MGLLTRKESDIQGRVGIGLGRHLLHLAAVQGDAVIRHRLATPLVSHATGVQCSVRLLDPLHRSHRCRLHGHRW